MAYNEQLANRIREKLQDLPNVKELSMMGGLAFMVNDKMCVGVMKGEMLCRVDPGMKEELLEKDGCHEFDFTGRPMKGFVIVDDTAIRSEKDLMYWINLCLEYNPKAKASKKK